MKKRYSKPEILFEDFSVSNSIAAGCETISNQTVDLCHADVPFGSSTISVFTSTVGGCVYKADSGEYNGICYHVPSVGYNVFTS